MTRGSRVREVCGSEFPLLPVLAPDDPDPPVEVVLELFPLPLPFPDATVEVVLELFPLPVPLPDATVELVLELFPPPLPFPDETVELAVAAALVAEALWVLAATLAEEVRLVWPPLLRPPRLNLL